MITVNHVVLQSSHRGWGAVWDRKSGDAIIVAKLQTLILWHHRTYKDEKSKTKISALFALQQSLSLN